MKQSTFNEQLFQYVQNVGPMYGVEDFSVLLYSLVKMQKSELVVELGSGSGCCSLLTAQAMKENCFGKIISFDNGSHWDRLCLRPELKQFEPNQSCSHAEFLTKMSKYFGVEQYVEYRTTTFPPFPQLEEKSIDILFVDYESHPAAIVAMLRHFMPKMAHASSIFIDGVATYLPSFLFLERLVSQLQAGKVPAAIADHCNPNLTYWIQYVSTHAFTLVHLNERKDRDQNSTTWLKIEPVDHLPHPITRMR